MVVVHDITTVEAAFSSKSRHSVNQRAHENASVHSHIQNVILISFSRARSYMRKNNSVHIFVTFSSKYNGDMVVHESADVAQKQ